MATKRIRSENFSMGQINFLTQKLREHKKAILNRGCTTEHHRIRDMAWKTVADQLNNLYPENKKNSAQLRNWLKNKKQRCRKEMKAYQIKCRAAASTFQGGVQIAPPIPPSDDIQDFWMMVRGPEDENLDSGSDNEGPQPWKQDEPEAMDHACDPVFPNIKVESAWSLEIEPGSDRTSRQPQPTLSSTPQHMPPFSVGSTSTPSMSTPQLKLHEPTPIAPGQENQGQSTIPSRQQSQVSSPMPSSQQHQAPSINLFRQQIQVPSAITSPMPSQVPSTVPYNNGKSSVAARHSEVMHQLPAKRKISEERSQEREELEHTLRVQRLKLQISNEKLKNKMLKFKWAKVMTKEINSEVSDDSD